MEHIWAGTQDFVTYSINDKRMPRRVRAFAQVQRSLYSHAQSMNADDGSDQNLVQVDICT